MLGSMSSIPVSQGFKFLPLPVPRPHANLPHEEYKNLITRLPYIIVALGIFFLPSLAAKYVPDSIKDTDFKEYDRNKDSLRGYSWTWWKQLVCGQPRGAGIKVEPMYSKGKAIVKIAKFIGVFLINAFAGEKLSIFFGGKGGKGETPPETPPEKPPETPAEPPKDPPPTPPSPPSTPDSGGMI